MNFSTISILQWFLVVWMLTIFMKCVFEVFAKEPPSGLFFGLLLIVVGCFWFLNLKNSLLLNSWISGFYVSGIIGIILISGGIRILLKPPLRSWVAGAVILVFVVSMFCSPSRKNTPSFFDFLDHLSINHVWNQEWLRDPMIDNGGSRESQYFGKTSEEKLTLSFKKANVSLRNAEMDQQFGIKGVLEVKPTGNSTYEIEGANNTESEIAVNPNLKELMLSLNVGNIYGILHNQMENIDCSTDTGNVDLLIKDHISKVALRTNIGNAILHIDEPCDQISIESTIGNIEVHMKKGILIIIDSADTRVGKTILPNDKDDKKGVCRIKAKTDIGNITILNDL
jgi:hypothetical protein